MKKKCLLLGGSGFIGQNLARFLKNNGYEITLYARSVENVFSTDELLEMKYIETDFFKDDKLEENIKDNDVIVHLISSVNPSLSMIEPAKCYNNDLVRTIDLLEAARKNNIKRIVFISSGGTVYGNYPAESYSEDMPNNPINHYGIMKLSIEKICLMYNEVYGMDNVILRISNPYGKGQDPNKNLGAVSVFTKKILDGDIIQIYGDGQNTRDYIYIDDVVRAIEKAIEYKSKKDVVPIFNIGSGVGTTLNELVKLISNALKKECHIEYIEDRGIDVHRNVLNMEKTISELRIKMNYNIKKGIQAYISLINKK